MEYCICVSASWRKRLVRHGLPVYFLRNYLKTPACFLNRSVRVQYGFVIILYLKLLPCQHTRLENDGHRFTLNQAFFIIQAFGNAVIYYVVKVVFLVNDFNAANRSYSLRIDVRAVETIFCKARHFLVRPSNGVA